MINSYFNIDQENREKQEQERIEAQIELDTDLYSLGWFDGLIGSEPSQLEEQSYWEGYQLGQREYWAKKLGVEIPTEF